MMIKRHVAVVAPVVGFLLGFLDFVWIKFLPSPFAGLGNSLAVWAVAAFLLTFLTRWRLPVAMLGAVVSLVVAVPSYYLSAALIQNDDWSNMVDQNAFIWMGFGVVAGLVFGAGGVLARSPGPLRLPASALPGSVLFAEAAIELVRVFTAAENAGGYNGYLVLVIVLGLLVTAVVARPWRDRALTLLWSVPVTAGGWVLLTFAGFR